MIIIIIQIMMMMMMMMMMMWAKVDFNATTALDDFRLVVLCLWCNQNINGINTTWVEAASAAEDEGSLEAEIL